MAAHTRRLKKKNRKTYKKGGFLPSIMGPFAQNAAVLTPLAIASGYRLVQNSRIRNTNTRKTIQVRKMRVQTRSKAKSRRRR